MKKIILLFFMCTFFVYSQGSTTVDEYNYLTKGYKIALDSGLDLKKGYGFREISTYHDPNYSFSFNEFVRTDKNEVCAIMVSAYSKLWNNQYYLCIPLNNSELYPNYIEKLKQWDRDILLSYSTALSSSLLSYQNKK